MSALVFENLDIAILNKDTQEMFKTKFLEVFDEETCADLLLAVNIDYYRNIWDIDYLTSMEFLQETKELEELKEVIVASINFLYELYCEKEQEVY